MEKLKLIVSEARSFAGTNFSKYESLIKEALKEHKVCTISYLHGKVETAMGYDIAACLNAEECANFEEGTYKEGIYDVEIVDYPNPCKAYLWNAEDGTPRGLIVDPLDEEDAKHAKQCYETKTNYL